MGFKEHKWEEMGRNALMFELIVRDQDFKKIETKKFKPKEFSEVIKDVSNRYGLKEERKSTREEIDEEIDFLKKSSIL